MCADREASAAAAASHAAAASFWSTHSHSSAAGVGSGLFGSLLGGEAAACGRRWLGPDVLHGRSFCKPLADDHPLNNDAGAAYEGKLVPSLLLGLQLAVNASHFTVTNICKIVVDVIMAVTAEDVESEEATWALYERWCKAFNKKRDNPVEKALRFKIFRDMAMHVHSRNTDLSEDPEEATILLERKRKAAESLDDDEDEEARAARLEEENLTLRERLFLMERDMDDLRRRLLAVEELCRDRHSDGCVVDAAADEAVLSESAAAVASPGAGEEADTVDAMAMEK